MHLLIQACLIDAELADFVFPDVKDPSTLQWYSYELPDIAHASAFIARHADIATAMYKVILA